MTSTKRKQINTLAESIREELKLTSPVNLEEAIEILNGNLKYIDSPIDNKIEAKIEKDGDSFTIQVQQKEPQTRVNFSIAHEIGHLFLHMGYLINPEMWEETGEYNDSVYYRFGYSEEEYEANEFAGAFLMPRAEFLSILEDSKIESRVDIENIANHFNVSKEAVLIRGRWLGVFRWE